MAAPNDLSSDVAARRIFFALAAALRFRCRAFLAALFDSLCLVKDRCSSFLDAENPLPCQKQMIRMSGRV